MLEKLGEFWCRHMHNGVMWPIHGKYQCRICQRKYQVAWAPVHMRGEKHTQNTVVKSFLESLAQ